MKCLLCSKDTIQKKVEGVEIDLCVNCGGVWLDGGEIEALTGQNLLEGRVLMCPKCDLVMLTRSIGAVEVDYCFKCGGTWLDKGELETISAIAKKGGSVAKDFRKFTDSVGRTRNIEIAKKEIQNQTANGEGIVDEVYVMYKDGLLITCSSKKIDEEGVNEDILAGTLMTIQDFVEVSFGKSGESRLKGIKFGNREIIIERGDNIITAIVASGNVPDNFNEDVQNIVKKIEDRYRVDLVDWDGNLGHLVGVQEFLTDILNKKDAEGSEEKGPEPMKPGDGKKKVPPPPKD